MSSERVIEAAQRRLAARKYIIGHKVEKTESMTLYGIRVANMDRDELLGFIGFLLRNPHAAQSLQGGE